MGAAVPYSGPSFELCRRRSRSWSCAEPFHRIVFAKGMALPIVRHQDAMQVRVSLETNAEKIIDFALVPIRRGPDGDKRGEYRILTRNPDAQPQRLAQGDRNQVVIYLETRFDGEAVYRRNIRKKIKLQSRLCLQKFRGSPKVLRRQHNSEFAAKLGDFCDRP